jgi:hypothetical protein
MEDPRGTLIHIGRDLSPGLDPRGATGPGQDPFLRDPVPHPAEEEDAEIARVVMEVEGGEAQVIAATAAMTIGVEAEAVDAVAVADVNGGLWFYSVEFGMTRKMYYWFWRYQWHLFSELPCFWRAEC